MSEKRITVWVQQFKDRDNLVLQWMDPFTGQRKSKSAETNLRPVAEMKRTELEYELNHGLHKEASRMSWEKFRELFETEYVSGKRPNTRDNYAETLNAFERLCHPANLRSISTRTISAFVGALRKEGGRYGRPMQESTIKTRLQFLHSALAWATKQKLIPECPTFPSVRPPKRKPQPVAVESFERLMDKAHNATLKTFLLCGWLAGLRLNEACALEWEETEDAPYLDLDRERIVFPAGCVKAAEDQWVPLDRELRAAILTLPRRGRKVFHFEDHREDKRKGRALKSDSVGSHISKLARKAGVKLTMKSLRRGFGCYWASRVPAQVLQKLMRHSNIRITMDYYANVDEAAMNAVLNREATLNNQIEVIRNTLRNITPTEPADSAESSATTP
jgi:integrase